MRHLNRTKHLNRSASHRKALLGNMSAALFEKKRITTTLAKAKFCRSRAERFISFAKKGTIAARRHIMRYMPQRDIVKMLFDEIAPKYESRPGGYTRIIKLGFRKGDAAPMAILELVGYEEMVISEKAKRIAEKKAKKEKAKEDAKKSAAGAPAPAETSKPGEEK